ncbi:MAG: hypothetical protein GQ564_14365 [Bacteroidales bacterium]|nr:hypothetical protein [Bacteroidales bacterium]
MEKLILFLILTTNLSIFSYGQRRYEGEPIIIYGEERSRKNDRNYDRGRNTEDKHEKRKREEEAKRKKEEEKKRRLELERIEREKAEKEKRRLKAENMVFELISFDTQRKLARETKTLSKFESLNTAYIKTIATYLNKIKLKEELLTEIEKEINLLRNNIQKENNSLKLRGELAIAMSSMCDRILDLLAFSADYTGSGVASSRIQFINNTLKEYIKNESLTVQWVIEEVYNYSSSNYLKNTQKSLLKSIEGLYGISKLMKELDENQRGYNKLQKKSIRELNKIEESYRIYYEEYKKLQNEFINIPNMDIYIKKNMSLIENRVTFYEIQIQDAKDQAKDLFPKN